MTSNNQVMLALRDQQLLQKMQRVNLQALSTSTSALQTRLIRNSENSCKTMLEGKTVTSSTAIYNITVRVLLPVYVPVH